MIFKKRYLVTFLLLILGVPLIAQQQLKLDSLKRSLKLAKHDTVKCKILNELTDLEENEDSWSIYNNELIGIAETNLKLPQSNRLNRMYKNYLATALNNLGISYDLKGDYNEAIKNYKKSLVLQSPIFDSIGFANTLQNIGTSISLQGNFLSAIDYYEKSLNILTRLGAKKYIAALLYNIGDIYKEQEDYVKAKEFYFKSLKISSEIQDQTYTPIILNSIADIYRISKKFEDALFYLQKSKSIIEKTKNEETLCHIYIELSSIYFDKNNADSSMYYAKKGYALSQKNEDAYSICKSQHFIGINYLEENNYIKALENLNNSIILAQKINYPFLIQKNALSLKKIYKELNQPVKALEMYELYISMREKTMNEEVKKASIKSQYKYEYALKANEERRKINEEKKISIIKQEKEKVQRFFLYGILILTFLFSIFIFNRFKLTQKQKIIIENQKKIVEDRQKETVDSITYAKRIQYALLANQELLVKNLTEHFVLFKPKDIVSGDFYWATEHDGKFYLAICDSTGHGVPGAFMSLLNMGFLSEAIKEKNITAPDKIFDYVRSRLINSIGNEGQQDGMDAILICIDLLNYSITYAAANNAPILIKENNLIELPKDKMPVGKGEKTNNFNLYHINCTKGDSIYLVTDGYADQFGGPKGKKFKHKPLNELLQSLQSDEMKIQKNKLNLAFENWKGDIEQVDDVCIIGIKI